MSSFGARVTTSYNNDVKMFHVKHSSLSDAETGKNLVQQVLNIHSAHKHLKRPNCPAQILCRKFGPGTTPQYLDSRRFHSLQSNSQRRPVTFSRHHTGSGRSFSQNPANSRDQGVDPRPCLS